MSGLLDRRVLSATHWYARIAGMLALVMVLATTTLVRAQRFSSLEPKITASKAKAMRGAVSKAIRDPAAFQANRKVVDDFFNGYYFRAMTMESMLGQLGKSREDLFKQYIRSAKVPEAQRHITDLTLKAMRAIAKGNFHPAVRYNATLILGMLDQKIAGGAGVKPVPLPAGAKELLDLLEQDEFKKVKVPASVKLAALIGLERHLRFGIDPQYADLVTKASLDYIAKEEPSKNLALEVHHWIKCQAASVLARQFAEGPSAEVQAALTGMIADPHMSLEDRCCVANLLGKIKYDATSGLDITASLQALGGLLKAVAEYEEEKATKIQEAALNDDFRAASFDDQPLPYQRRRLIAHLDAIDTGGRSLSKGLPEAESQKLQSLLTTLHTVMSVADDEDSGDLEITTEVIEMATQVRNALEGLEKAPAADSAAEEEVLDLES